MIALAVLGAVAAQDRVPLRELFLDAGAVAGGRWYAGLVSSLGVLAWTVAVTGAAGTAYVAHLGGRIRAAVAFRSAAIVFALFLFDDLFQFHVELLPKLTGIPKVGWLAALLVVASLWLIPALPELARTRWELLLAAAAGLGVSLSVDVLVGQGGDWYPMFEDGPKFLGVVALATWSVVSAADIVRSVVSERSAATVVTAPGSDRAHSV